jgi:plastocyanin
MRPLSLKSIPAALATALLCSSLVTQGQAQTTFQVNLQAQSFTPKNLVINQGDTVQWNWIVGFHDVVSGTSGIPDGVFISGPAVVVSDPYFVTFDGALVWKYPKPNNTYPYYCNVHLPGMTGTVRVNNLSGSMLAYGANNPAGSLDWRAGNARVGKSMTFSVDNTVNPADGPGFAFLLSAGQPAAGFPGGISLPGFGMAGPGVPGDLLINLAPPDPFLTLGPTPWAGSGNPVDFVVNVPANPNLVGLSVYFQGATLTPSAVDGIGLTNGLRATLGA